LITGYQTVIVADAIITTEQALAGAVHMLSVDDLGKTVKPYASHALDLKTTVELGKKLGYDMPETIRIYAVEIKEHMVFREGLSPEVEAAVLPLARRIMQDLGKEEPSTESRTARS
jgi:hydrogenase maturation protease